MLETSLWLFFLNHLPSMAIGVGVAATYLKINGIFQAQGRDSLRMAKLVKLHIQKHPEDGGYLVDDTREV